ncbi:MAG TPA: hypothetical protein VNB06_07415 [Thermoanaerobaculia bacterium]|nr:hypothetical protein [Thermoanaerobaculia bacterium]
MEPRTKRALIGCAGGCGALVLLLVGSCVGVTAWLRAPGELLEPQRLLDPEAVGYMETRLELDNPGTEALVAAAVQLMESQRPPVDFPLARLFFRWNVARQERDLRRAFPARLVWTAYPAVTPGDTESVASLSIQRAGHQLVLADWLFEWGLGRAGKDTYLDYAGERVMVIRQGPKGRDNPEGHQESGEAEAPQLQTPVEPGEGDQQLPTDRGRSYYLFLRGDGAFFATGERVVRRAIDLLARPDVREGWVPSRLGALLAELPEDRQLRGAMLNDAGELLSLLGPILDAGEEGGAALDRDAWRDALSRVEAATFAGGFEPTGDAVLEVELLAAPEDRALLLEVVDETIAAAREELDLDRETRETQRGVAILLRLRDVPLVVREMLERRGVRLNAPVSH